MKRSASASLLFGLGLLTSIGLPLQLPAQASESRPAPEVRTASVTILVEGMMKSRSGAT